MRWSGLGTEVRFECQSSGDNGDVGGGVKVKGDPVMGSSACRKPKDVAGSRKGVGSGESQVMMLRGIDCSLRLRHN